MLAAMNEEQTRQFITSTISPELLAKLDDLVKAYSKGVSSCTRSAIVRKALEIVIANPKLLEGP